MWPPTLWRKRFRLGKRGITHRATRPAMARELSKRYSAIGAIHEMSKLKDPLQSFVVQRSDLDCPANVRPSLGPILALSANVTCIANLIQEFVGTRYAIGISLATLLGA